MSALRRGSTLRRKQQRSGARPKRSLPSLASCSATVCSGSTVIRLIGIVAATASRVPIVSVKWYPVSRKTTSIPGATFDAMSMSTASAIDEVTQNRAPKVSTAHSTITEAGASSSSAPATVAMSRSSSALRRSTSTSVTVMSSRLLGGCSALAGRRNEVRKPSGKRGIPIRRACRRAVEGLRRRSTGSGTGSTWSSSQHLLVGAGDPGGERLAVRTLVEIPTNETFDVVGEVDGGELVRPELAAEPRFEPERATEVHLESRHLLAVLIDHQLALEADVDGLDARARVGAAVQRHADRHVEFGHAAFELVDQLRGTVLGVDDRQLAVFDARARERVASPLRRAYVQTETVECGDQ